MYGRKSLTTRINSGPGVLRGKENKMYKMVDSNIGKWWFDKYMANSRRALDYALYNGRGELQGYAVMGENKNTPIGKSTYLYLIGANPLARGKGFGTQILKRLIKDAKERHVRYIFLEPTTESVRIWYRKYGFRDVNPEVMALEL